MAAMGTPPMELMYFDIAGKAEAIRIAAAYGKMPSRIRASVATTSTRLSADAGTLPVLRLYLSLKLIYPILDALASLAQQYGQVPALRNHANGGACRAERRHSEVCGQAGIVPPRRRVAGGEYHREEM